MTAMQRILAGALGAILLVGPVPMVYSMSVPVPDIERGHSRIIACLFSCVLRSMSVQGWAYSGTGVLRSETRAAQRRQCFLSWIHRLNSRYSRKGYAGSEPRVVSSILADGRPDVISGAFGIRSTIDLAHPGNR